MKSKHRIINIALGVLLMVSLGFTLIQLQQLNTAKQTLSVIQAEYDTSKSELDASKAKLTEVQASLEQAKVKQAQSLVAIGTDGSTVGSNANTKDYTIKLTPSEAAAMNVRDDAQSKPQSKPTQANKGSNIQKPTQTTENEKVTPVPAKPQSGETITSKNTASNSYVDMPIKEFNGYELDPNFDYSGDWVAD